MKQKNIHSFIAAIATLIIICSCSAKESDVTAGGDQDVVPSIVDASNNASLKYAVNGQYGFGGQYANSIDSTGLQTETDSMLIGCYKWDHKYKTKTRIVPEDGSDPYYIQITIVLQEDEEVNKYYGLMELYITEEQCAQVFVKGESCGNHVDVYYVEDPEDVSDKLFRDKDKLVRFELSEGMYEASWFTPMRNYITPEGTEDISVSD